MNSQVLLTSPQLLVSVRSRLEFQSVCGLPGIDIVDFKEPGHGPLAPSSPELWQWVVNETRLSLESGVATSLPQLSAALGEFDQAVVCAKMLPDRFHFAKMGPSKCGRASGIIDRWNIIKDAIPSSVELVAVAYADFQAAESIKPIELLPIAAANGFRHILIDTFQKDGVCSIDHLGIEGLVDFAIAARRTGMWWSVAGSVQTQNLGLLSASDVRPDCIGIRGAVCEGGRENALSVLRCHQWVEAQGLAFQNINGAILK